MVHQGTLYFFFKVSGLECVCVCVCVWGGGSNCLFLWKPIREMILKF